MKILVISPMYPNEQDLSFGCFIEQLEIFMQLNYPVQYIHAIRYRNNSSKLTKYISYIHWVVRVFWLGLSKEYDIIHAHTLFPAGVLGMCINFFKKKSVVLTSHGSDICLIKDKNFIVQWLSKKALSKADSIQAVSNYIKDRIIDFYPLSSKKIFVQCMGVDMSFFKPGDGLYQVGEKTSMIFVGNMIKKKGWKKAFQTVEYLCSSGINCSLNVYGGGKDSLLAQDWILKNNMEAVIKMHGVKSKNEISVAMQNADLFLFPSEYDEAFSLVTAEALASGVSVVVSAKGALVDMVSGIRGSFLVEDFENISALSIACQKALKYRKKQIGKKKKSLLHGVYSLEASSKKMIYIYEYILNRK